VPMLDEVGSVVALHERLCSALAGLPLELVFVDDGSTDGTFEALQTIAARDNRVRVIRLSRNFGHQPALTAGLEHTRGDAVVMIDADLQDPPEVIPDLVQAWRAGGDVVIARRLRRDGETWFKLVTARLFYRTMSAMSHIPLEPDAGDFRLLDRAALDALLAMPERTRFLRGMTTWIGFDQVVVPYERHERHAGRTKYPLRRMVRFAVDGITSFSRLPLQLATVFGFVFSLVALPSRSWRSSSTPACTCPASPRC
jgi:glycosyltransferase involved in cell wall biosynthesis